MAKKQKGSFTTPGKKTLTVHTAGKTALRREAEVRGTTGKTPLLTATDVPHSTVSVGLGFKVTENYQAADIHATVTIPVDIGNEAVGLASARDIADTFLADSHDDVMAALEGLSS